MDPLTPCLSRVARRFQPFFQGAALLLWGLCLPGAFAQLDEDFKPATLKRLPLEQLVDVEITSVTGHAQPLSKAPAAIGVVTAEDIRRTGVTNVPDALRLATGLDVAQIDGHTWAISARGFNTSAANKLQVLMDGRNVYTPLFSGVFWDVQRTFMPDIEQIEVIRGPGATLWGANAVNGVINISSKSAKDTQGWLMRVGGGIGETGFGGVRYGGRSGDTYYRAYVSHLSRDSLTLESGGEAGDEYGLTQGGFRLDSDMSPDDLLTVQGDIYQGRFGQFQGSEVEVSGGNLLARWTREISPDSSMMLKAYYDVTHRFNEDVFEESLHSFDLDWQRRFAMGEVHDIVWGLSARVSLDDVSNLGPTFAFLPEEADIYVFSGYIQDEIRLVPKILWLTLGSKFEHNSFSGFEVQPSMRLTYTPTSRQTLWGAVSRAVRTPSRIDQDLYLPNPAFKGAATASTGSLLLLNNPDFDSEELVAYELGYRFKQAANLTADIALFYHDYDHLRSVEPVPGSAPFSRLENKQKGESYGAELGVKWQPTSWWQLGVGYTLMQKDIRAMEGSQDMSGGSGEGNDPQNILVARSAFELPGGWELDAVFRYVGERPHPMTAAYSTVDLRLAWQATDRLEFAVVGRNLLDDRHVEFAGAQFSREIGRSVYFTSTWNF